jgi:hypothetical protein
MIIQRRKWLWGLALAFCVVACAHQGRASSFFCLPGVPGTTGPPAPPPANNFVTDSTTCSEQVQTTNLTQRADQFSTELLVRMLGGPLLLDQTFQSQLSDPAGQAALLNADGLLTADGALSFIGPTLLSSNTILTGSNTVTNVVQSAPAQSVVEPGVVFIGPTTVQWANIGLCQGVDTSGIPFGCDPAAGNHSMLAFGSSDVNVDIHTTYFVIVTNTTTNTFQTSQVYELDGLTGATPTPEPGTFGLTAAAIAALWLGLGALRKSKTARRPADSQPIARNICH